MNASAKDVTSQSTAPEVVEPTWRFRTAIPEAQVTAEAHRLRVIAIYRARTQECLERARLARNDDLVAAAHGYLDEAETWARFADEWARRAQP